MEHMDQPALLELLERFQGYVKRATGEEWWIGRADLDSHEDMLQYIGAALQQHDSLSLYMTCVGDAETEGASRIVAITGNGEHSEANAEYLVCVQPANIRKLLDLLQWFRREYATTRAELERCRRMLDALREGGV